MDLIIGIIVGAIAGVAALYVVHRRTPSEPLEWIGAILVGIIGGWLGSFLFGLIGLGEVNIIGSIVVAFVGALIIVLAIQRLAPSGRGGDRDRERNTTA
jgi:uncharacterized membrane protein YeaQ/YmgE (transglycosylase-associated protein family)